MFLGKARGSREVEEARLQWPEVARKYQRARFSIEKVRHSLAGPLWSAELEGASLAPPFTNVIFSATMELLDPFETPRRLLDVWGEPLPEGVQGTCQLQQLDGPDARPHFNATLFCGLRAMESLRLITTVAAVQGAAAVLDLEIDHPRHVGPELWADAWRATELRVRNWRLTCETQLKR